MAPAALDALVPGLLLQSLVENAVRHGVARSTRAGEIVIRGYRDDGTLVLEVCDNGLGFRAGWELDPARGLGLANTRERLAHMYGGNFSLDTTNLAKVGAAVTVALSFRTALAREWGPR